MHFLGAYCPKNLSQNFQSVIADPKNLLCPPGYVDNMFSTFVERSFGVRFYCPVPAQAIPCAQGHFCREGSTKMTPCPVWALGTIGCGHEKMPYPNHYVMILFVLVVILLFFLMMTISWCIISKKIARDRAGASEQKYDEFEFRNSSVVMSSHTNGDTSLLGSTVGRVVSKLQEGVGRSMSNLLLEIDR
jgi:hypothetical protein